MTKHLTQIGDEVREMTEAELEQWQADFGDLPEPQTEAQILEAQAAKVAARQSVLDKLGLTADEAAALFG